MKKKPFHDSLKFKTIESTCIYPFKLVWAQRKHVKISYGYQCLLGIFSVLLVIICTGLFLVICLNTYARRLASPVSTSSHNIWIWGSIVWNELKTKTKNINPLLDSEKEVQGGWKLPFPERNIQVSFVELVITNNFF